MKKWNKRALLWFFFMTSEWMTAALSKWKTRTFFSLPRKMNEKKVEVFNYSDLIKKATYTHSTHHNEGNNPSCLIDLINCLSPRITILWLVVVPLYARTYEYFSPSLTRKCAELNSPKFNFKNLLLYAAMYSASLYPVGRSVGWLW